MKYFYLLFLTVFIAGGAFAQKKEKVKGSKTVTVIQKEIESFDSLEVEDNIEVYLVKGEKQGLEIEADDNLHEIIKTDLNGTNLRIYTSKNVTSHQKLSVKVTYTNELKMITAKHETVLNALAELTLPDVTIKSFDYSKSFLNVKCGKFGLIMNDKTKAEINLHADTTAVELSKNAEIKALIATTSLKFDMYQKAKATIEGDAANVQLRLDNNASFTGKKFTVKNMEVLTEGYSSCNILATENVNISATGKSEIELYGSPKINIKNFAENATIYRKTE